MVTDADRQPPAGDWCRGATAVAVLSFDMDAETPIFNLLNLFSDSIS